MVYHTIPHNQSLRVGLRSLGGGRLLSGHCERQINISPQEQDLLSSPHMKRYAFTLPNYFYIYSAVIILNYL
jgi:hypothetical protein